DHVRVEIEQAGDRHVDAIGGRSVPVTEAVGRAAEHERTVEGERVGRAAAVAFRGDDGDVPERAQPLGERGEAGSEVAVVVREEDSHAGKNYTVRRPRTVAWASR